MSRHRRSKERPVTWFVGAAAAAARHPRTRSLERHVSAVVCRYLAPSKLCTHAGACRLCTRGVGSQPVSMEIPHVEQDVCARNAKAWHLHSVNLAPSIRRGHMDLAYADTRAHGRSFARTHIQGRPTRQRSTRRRCRGRCACVCRTPYADTDATARACLRLVPVCLLGTCRPRQARLTPRLAADCAYIFQSDALARCTKPPARTARWRRATPAAGAPRRSHRTDGRVNQYGWHDGLSQQLQHLLVRNWVW